MRASLLPAVLISVAVCCFPSQASRNTTDAFALSVYDIPPCSLDQLKLGEFILTTEPSTLQCEALFGIPRGMLLQSADVADELCGQQSCLNALHTLFAALPNCRYELWGLRHSAAKLLAHCGVLTNATSL
jgi:hypothetical protein